MIPDPKPFVKFFHDLANIISHFEKPLNYQPLSQEVIKELTPNYGFLRKIPPYRTSLIHFHKLVRKRFCIVYQLLKWIFLMEIKRSKASYNSAILDVLLDGSIAFLSSVYQIFVPGFPIEIKRRQTTYNSYYYKHKYSL